MTVTVNGKKETMSQPKTLLDFLRAKGIEPKTVVVEHNGDIPDRAEWGKITLADRDVLEILKFMGGGAF